MVFNVTNKIYKVYDHRFYQVANENPLKVKTMGQDSLVVSYKGVQMSSFSWDPTILFLSQRP